MFKFITVAALLATAAGDGLRPRQAIEEHSKRQLIVGGQNANDVYPWFVQFGNNRCGGTLFDPQHVLTSATCVTPNAPKIVWINADTREGDDGQAYEYEVECAIRHPNYDQKSVSLVADVLSRNLIRRHCIVR
jgi:secreted trypsin-like serine protease